MTERASGTDRREGSYNLRMPRCTRRELLAAAGLGLCRTARGMPLEKIQLGVTTDEIDEDLAAAVRFLRRFNLRWAEVRSIWGKYNTAQPVEKIVAARALLDEHGIRVSVESTGFFKVPLPAETPEGRRALDEQWALLDAAMERAKLFGTRKIRVFGFTNPRGNDYPRIYELIREAARRAKGFRLALENVGGSYIASGAQAAELLKHVQEDNVGLTWDPNNAGASGERAFPDGYRKLDPARIFHVHLRDYRRRADGKADWTAVGQGEFDNLGQIRALLKEGYRESFTLETHWKSPQGKAHASETSLKALLKVIEQV
jgi:sugar phosphate isomerase/epimerase